MYVVDGAKDAIADVIKVGDRPEAVAVNPVTHRIYVSNLYDGNVSALYQDEALGNPSFEEDADQDNLPDGWRGQNLGRGDGLARRPYAGSLAFHLEGGSLRKRLTQRLGVSGSARTTINLEAFARARNIAANGTLKILVEIEHAEGTSQTVTLRFPAGDYSWKRRSARSIIEKAFTDLRASIVFESPTGQAWLDDLHVWVERP